MTFNGPKKQLVKWSLKIKGFFFFFFFQTGILFVLGFISIFKGFLVNIQMVTSLEKTNKVFLDFFFLSIFITLFGAMAC